MVYVSFVVYVLLILFAGVGVYKLWCSMIPPAAVNWALLPGTLVSEMAYILGCLVTGGEVKRAKLMDGGGGGGKKGGEGGKGGGPTTESSGGVKGVGPIVAAALAIIACGAGIVVADSFLGQDVMYGFDGVIGGFFHNGLPRELPGSWDSFWQQVQGQVRLLKNTCEAWRELEWSNWHVPLFVYLALCLSVRLAPARRDMRWTLLAAVVIAAVIALLGATVPRLHHLMQDIWPLVTYVWASLLFLLIVTLLLQGVTLFVRVLAGKGGKKTPTTKE